MLRRSKILIWSLHGQKLPHPNDVPPTPTVPTVAHLNSTKWRSKAQARCQLSGTEKILFFINEPSATSENRQGTWSVCILPIGSHETAFITASVNKGMVGRELPPISVGLLVNCRPACSCVLLVRSRTQMFRFSPGTNGPHW